MRRVTTRPDDRREAVNVTGGLSARPGGRAVAASIAAALALNVSACTSGGHRPGPDPVAACRATLPAVSTPRPAANPQPGDVRWSVLLDRCTAVPRPAWDDLRGGAQIGAMAPGERLVVAVDGVVSGYDPHTGARSWQRTVVPPSRDPQVLTLQAAQDLVSRV
jgi:hypothetical protein